MVQHPVHQPLCNNENNRTLRMHIFGASGSGVTTLGGQLVKQLAIPYYDADDFFWEKTSTPFTVKRNPAERNALLETTLLSQPQWILGGSMISWNSMVKDYFSLVVFLWIPGAVRMQRLMNRERERYGTAIDTDPERKRLHAAFIEWAADYDENTGVAKRTLSAHEEWLKTIHQPILQLRGDLTTGERIQKITGWLQQNSFEE
ncbi:MAG: adenylate kinase [Bacteroidetes bacterium]|nr:adenylate kinase [Bacteroidota bacterium]